MVIKLNTQPNDIFVELVYMILVYNYIYLTVIALSLLLH